MAEIKEYKNLINGEWRESKEQITIYSPIDNKEIGKVQAMTHKEIENELGCWGDIIRENPDRYAYVRQHFSNDVCDLKPITYSALWNLLLHSEANDLYYYNENHAIDETCVFYEFYYDLGFELPEDRGLDMNKALINK